MPKTISIADPKSKAEQEQGGIEGDERQAAFLNYSGLDIRHLHTVNNIQYCQRSPFLNSGFPVVSLYSEAKKSQARE